MTLTNDEVHHHRSGYEEEAQAQDREEGETRVYSVTDGLKSPYTKIAYRQAFNDFLRYIGNKNHNENQFHHDQHPDPQELRTLLDYKPSVIESKIIDYIEYLKLRKLSSYSTIQVHCSGIVHFFDINDVNLNKRKIKRFFPQNESDHYFTDRPYSIKEIESILSKCDIRSRVIVLLMASTGMRISGVRELRYGDIKKIDEFGLYMIWVYNRSKADRYYTFCTPECAIAIDAYLEYRRKFGEELMDKSPLIREQFNIDNPFTVNAPRFLSKRMMSFIIEDALNRSGVNPVRVGRNEQRDVMSSHGLRKFFVTQCGKAHLSYTTWKYLAGHKLTNTDASYMRTSEEDRLAEYVQAIDFLTIDPTKRLQQKVKDLEGQQANEIAQLKERVEFLDKHIHLWARAHRGLTHKIENEEPIEGARSNSKGEVEKYEYRIKKVPV